jgi:phosphotriesterase-related protein
MEQIRVLADCGVDTGHVAVSHVDKIVDRGYHNEIAATGAFAVYDQSFRWHDRSNGTLTLLEWALEDGRSDRVMLGMDAARQGYYRAFGGSPGLDYLLGPFSREMESRGIDSSIRRRLFVDNPGRSFSFTAVATRAD